MLNLDDAFSDMISQRAIYQRIAVTQGQVKQVRHRIRHGRGAVSAKLKRQWLKKAGYRQASAEMWYGPEEALRKEYDSDKYNRKDMIDFARFFHRQSSAARTDAEYCLDKFQNRIIRRT